MIAMHKPTININSNYIMSSITSQKGDGGHLTMNIMRQVSHILRESNVIEVE